MSPKDELNKSEIVFGSEEIEGHCFSADYSHFPITQDVENISPVANLRSISLVYASGSGGKNVSYRVERDFMFIRWGKNRLNG